MEKKKIDRINELYWKEKNKTITREELLEQKKLRDEYISLVRKNLRGTLDHTVIEDEYGNRRPLRHKDISKN